MAAAKRPREEGASKENSPTNGQVSLVTPCMQFGNSSSPFFVDGVGVSAIKIVLNGSLPCVLNRMVWLIH